MRHRISGRTFGRRSGPRKALLRGLASHLIDSERITTTVAKAKELRKYVEPLVTLAKRGDLHARRMVAGEVYRKETVQKLFDDLAVRFKDRPGGYTRIMRSNHRQGDGADMAIIEFLDRPNVGEAGASQRKKKAIAKKSKDKNEKDASKKTVAKKETKDTGKKETIKASKKAAQKVTKKSSNSK